MLNLSKDNMGMFCQICDYLTVTNEDLSSKIKTGTCRECELKFVLSDINNYT